MKKYYVKYKGDVIGYVYEDTNGWNSVPYVGDIGHGLIDSKEDAIQDVIDIFNEHEYYNAQKTIKNI